MNLKSIYTQTAEKLNKNYTYNESLEISFRLLEHLFSITKLDILVDKTILNFDEKIYNNLVNRLLANEPIQFVLGYAWFLDKKFFVNKNVLIPRPETEELVNLIIKENRTKSELNILDIGTGSGCIAISLASYLKNASVFGLDISTNAIEIAKKNAATHQVNVNFLEENMENTQKVIDKIGKPFDILVSNPPYVLETEKKEMKKNVLDFEPNLALFVENENPLRYYEACLKIAQKTFCKNSKVYFEINENLGESMANLLLKYQFSDIRIIKDFHNKNRFATGVWLID